MEVNNKLFSRGGRIGRKQYFIQQLGLLFFPWLLGAIIDRVCLNGAKLDIGWNSLTYFYFAFGVLEIILIFYVGIIMDFKRLRDIKGQEQISTFWVFLILFPLTNIFITLYLLTCPGAKYPVSVESST